MSELNDWDVSANNNNLAPPNGWPENTMQYSEVNDTGREGMAVMARYWKDTNGSLVATGASDAYLVTLNATYSAYFAGMYFACQIPADSGFAPTMNVNGIGAAPIVQRSGSAIPVGALQQDGIYEFRYDGTNFQLMGTVTGAVEVNTTADILANIAIATPPTNSSNPTAELRYYDLDKTDQLGSVGFSATSRLEIKNLIRSGDFNILVNTSAGDDINAMYVNPDQFTYLYSKGVLTLNMDTPGEVAVTSVGSTDAETRRITFDHQDNSLRGFVGYAGDDELQLRNAIHGGDLRLSAEDAGGTIRNILDGDPDGNTTLYRAGVARMTMAATGLVRVASDASPGVGSSQSVYLSLEQADGVDVAQMGFNASAAMIIKSLNHGASVSLRGEDAGGVERILFLSDPDGASEIYHQGLERFTTTGSGGILVAATSPGVGSAQNIRLIMTQADGSNVARIGFNTQTALDIRNQNEGGNVTLSAEDALGVAQNLLVGDPDGTVDIYADGTKRLGAETAGHIAVFSNGNTDTENRYVSFEHQNETRRGYVGYQGSGVLRLRNEIHGENIIIDGEDAGGTVRTILTADPDGLTTLRAASNVQLECNGGETVLIGNTNADVALYWNDIESFRTQDSDANTKTVGAEVLHADGTFYNIGLNVSAPKVENSSFSAAATWQDHAGHTIMKTTTATPTYTTPGSTDAVIPNGSLWNIQNIGSSGDITIAAGSGVTLTWQDGNGGATGSRTIAPGGAATLWKRLDTEFYLYGNGIS